jgi:transmembrane sensor
MVQDHVPRRLIPRFPYGIYGTVARLGPNTALHAVIGSQTREVRVEGRAFFAVTADPDRPFHVRAESGEVRVLGTRFELDARRDRVRLLVVDGEVSLSALGREAELRAGDLGEASSEEPLAVTRVEVPERLLDWMGAWVAFEETPLRQVATELEVRLGLRIELADPALADRTITGWFSEEDRGQILTMVCRVAEVRCVEAGDRVRMDLP